MQSSTIVQKKRGQITGQAMQFGLMFFSSGESAAGQNKYHLLLESAKFADQHGFSSVWVPERHFTAMGCIYPNPTVVQAALARETQRIRLQAGSVVLPLHHPIRVTEEWSIVDNLSDGRVGVSFASGWNPSDFVFFPERFADRYQEMCQGIHQVQKLWRGEFMSITRGDGRQQDVKVYPSPVQPELPIWLTAASNPRTFIKAGELGINLLPHLFDQEVEVLAEKIALYRQARLQHGHDPDAGQVTVALHTFVGKELDIVQEQVRVPYCNYLKSNINILKGLGESRDMSFSIESLSPQDLDSLTNLVFDKFFYERRALLGTPESCSELVERLRQIGVNEVACLLDFGPDDDLILEHLPYLDQLRQACEKVNQPIVQSSVDLTKFAAFVPKQPCISSEPDFEASLDDIQSRCQQESTGLEFYQRLQAQGVDIGSGVQGIAELWQGTEEALGKICLPDSLTSKVADYGFHPALLDICLQVFLATMPTDENGELQAHYQPTHLGKLELEGTLHDTEFWSHATLRSKSADDTPTYEGDVRILNPAGQVVIRVTGLRLRQTSVEPQTPLTKDWFYGIEWQPRPIRQAIPDYLASPQEIGQQVRQQMTQQEGWSPLGVYQSLLPQLEALSVNYILWAFHQMGIELQQGQRLLLTDINQQVADDHQRLFRRLLQNLQQVRICRAMTNDEWEVTQTVAIANPQTTLQSLQAQYPQCSADLELLGCCGQHLAAVLQGKIDPLELFGSTPSLDNFYQNSPGTQVTNQLVQEAIKAALAQLPEDRMIRILEIGAGGGATTAAVLPVLPADRTDYRFTDLSTPETQLNFQDYPFVTYQVLDIEQAPQEQGFLEHQYDLIIATNGLHATADITQALNHVKQMLAPKGLLVLLEQTRPQASTDLIFGLFKDWWKFTDAALRSDSALLSTAQWQTLLQQLNFSPVEVITAETEALAQPTVILATGPNSQQDNGAGNIYSATASNQWLIFADSEGIGHQIAEQLQSQDNGCLVVVPGEAYQVIEANQIQLNPKQPDDFQRLFKELADRDVEAWRGVVYLWGLYASATSMTVGELESVSYWSAHTPLHLLRALDGVNGFQKTPLWWVTQGAQRLETEPLAIAQSLLWGLGRVLSVEQPQQWGGLIDLDPQLAQSDPATHAAEVLSVIQEHEHKVYASCDDHLAFRRGQCYSAQLTSQTNQLAEISTYRWQPEASYLIAGGLGDLGLFIADWMAKRGAKHIVLLGRTPLPSRDDWSLIEPDSTVAKRIKAIQAIEKSGAKVYLAYADVANEDQVGDAIANVEQQGCPPIRGLFHLATVPSPMQSLVDTNVAALEHSFKPKVQGSWCLHRLFADEPLDFFILFSSWAGLLGDVGQKIGGYSMANTFMDALAHHRRSLGQAALSINWGDWDEIGIRARYIQQGYQMLPDSWALKPSQGIQALAQLLSQPMAQMAVLPVPWAEYFKLFPQAATKAFLQPIAQTSGQQSQIQVQRQFLQTLESLPVNQRLEKLVVHVQTQVASIMGVSPPESLDLERGLFEMGMDSLMALELKNTLESNLGIFVPAVAAFEHPSVVALSTYLAQEILEWEIPNQSETSPEPEQESDNPLDKITQLSDDEIERLFAEKIAR